MKIVFQQGCAAAGTAAKGHGCGGRSYQGGQGQGMLLHMRSVYDLVLQVIAAEGEQKASSALRAASEIIACSPSAMQLRYLQTLNSISAEKNSTIIFPIPMDIIMHSLKKK